MGRRDDQKQWLVLAVGPGRKLKNGTVLAPEVQAGDKILYEPATSGSCHSFDDGRLIIDASLVLMSWK